MKDGKARATAATAVLVVLGVLVTSPLGAQTLTAPNSGTAAPRTETAKTRPTAHVKTCSQYGAGFVNVPGTDACMKIGGGVRAEFGR